MVDASTAFNAKNREAFLHNTKILCSSPYISPTATHHHRSLYLRWVIHKIRRGKNTRSPHSNGNIRTWYNVSSYMAKYKIK